MRLKPHPIKPIGICFLDAATIRPHVEACLAGEEIAWEEVLYTEIDLRTMRVFYTPEWGPDGRVQGVLAVIHDITKEKQTEQQLQTVQAQHHLFLDNIEEAVIVYDPEWRITYVNRKACEMSKMRREEMLGRTEWELFPEMEEKATTTFLKQAKEERRHVQIEDYYAPLDVWYETDLYPLSDGGAVVFTRDISERKQAEATLRESQALLQKAVSIETVGVLFFRLDGSILDANAAFERMAGYRLEELRSGLHWETLTPPEFRELTRQTAEALATWGEAVPYEKQMIRKDGSRWWGLFAPTRLRGKGSSSECVEFIIDITERKQAEAAQARSQAEIEALNDQLRRAMTETHHRVKNNLQVITAMVEMQILGGAALLPTTEFERLNTHMRTLAVLHDLLTQETREDRFAQVLSVRQLLEKTLSLAADRAGVSLRIHRYRDASAGSESLRPSADRQRTGQQRVQTWEEQDRGALLSGGGMRRIGSGG